MNTTAEKYTCLIVDDEPVAIALLEDLLQDHFPNIEVAARFTYWTDALQYLKTEHCDLLFLDISMQGKNWLQLIRCVPELKSEVVFVTAYSDYALDAFRLSAAGYLLKPLDETELTSTVNKVLERVSLKKHAERGSAPAASYPKKIGIPSYNAIEYFNVDDIVYLAAANSYTKVVLGNKEITSAYNLQKFKTSLDEQLFFQVHRSYIINLNHIHRFENSGLLIMDNHAELPVAKTTKEKLLRMFDRVRGETVRTR